MRNPFKTAVGFHPNAFLALLSSKVKSETILLSLLVLKNDLFPNKSPNLAMKCLHRKAHLFQH